MPEHVLPPHQHGLSVAWQPTFTGAMSDEADCGCGKTNRPAPCVCGDPEVFHCQDLGGLCVCGCPSFRPDPSVVTAQA